MKIYILGICGAFMAGIALLARELGCEVTGSDASAYPPMSTQLEQAGIELHEGYNAAQLPDDCDCYVVGNAMTRGNPQFETILERNLPYTSGPQWLYEQVLHDRWVLAVAGTHGKTTVTSMLSWILDQAGLDPGYLIGGISQDLHDSARLGSAPFFVIEADEYDSALFDKRSKFVHYHPRTLILNNLEFDHADIFDDLTAIQRQFHHLVRTLPASAQIIVNHDDPALRKVMQMGCWSEQLGLSIQDSKADFYLDANGGLHESSNARTHQLQIAQHGQFNRQNAAMAMLAARHAGVSFEHSMDALSRFNGVKRRQEIIAEIDGVRIIDDFAHHPTAIESTLTALKGKTPGRLIAVLDIRSNTMKMRAHTEKLAQALEIADLALLCETPNVAWDMAEMAKSANTLIEIKPDTQHLTDYLSENSQNGDQIVIMSNGGFDGIHRRLVDALRA